MRLYGDRRRCSTVGVGACAGVRVGNREKGTVRELDFLSGLFDPETSLVSEQKMGHFASFVPFIFCDFGVLFLRFCVQI